MNATYTPEQITITIVDVLAKDKAQLGEAAVRARYARAGRPMPEQDLRFCVEARNGRTMTTIVFPVGWSGSAQQVLALLNRAGEDVLSALGEDR